jgi:hypothetical protein
MNVNIKAIECIALKEVLQHWSLHFDDNLWVFDHNGKRMTKHIESFLEKIK